MLEGGDEGVGIEGLLERLVIRQALGGKVSGEVIIRIALTLGALDPDLFTTDALTQGMEGRHLIIDPVHPRVAFGVWREDQLAPLTRDPPVAGHIVLDPIAASFAPRILLHQVECCEHGLMVRVGRRELQGG